MTVGTGVIVILVRLLLLWILLVYVALEAALLLLHQSRDATRRVCLLFDLHRNRELERRTGAECTLDLDAVTTHGLNETERDDETEAGTAELIRRVSDLTEGAEELLQLIVADTDTCIAYNEVTFVHDW